MSQSLSAVYLHLIFSTKNREPWLIDAALREELHAFLGGVSKQLDCPPVIVGGVTDHVHLLARFGRGVTQSDWVKELKRVSSRWIKERDGRMAGFAWQGGYGVFSVSPSALEDVEKYVFGMESRWDWKNNSGRRPHGSNRVIRGGSWNNNANNARCANRNNKSTYATSG